MFGQLLARLPPQPNPRAAIHVRNEFDTGLLEGGLNLLERGDGDVVAAFEPRDGGGSYTSRLGEVLDAPIQGRTGHLRLTG